MRHSRLLAAVFLALPAALTMSAQTPAGGRWFGKLQPPPPLSDPHRAVVDVANVKPPALVLPAGESLDPDLNGPAIYKDLQRIVEFSREDQAAGSKAWGRITGFSGAANALNWAGTQFGAAGLQGVQVQEYTGSGPGMWQPASWEVRVLPDAKAGATAAPVVLGSAFPTSGSMVQGGTITASIVDSGMIDAPLPTNLDVKGKVVLQSVSAASAYAARTNVGTRARDLAARGAVAVINAFDQVGNMYVRDFGNCGVPCFNVGGADGEFLHSALTFATLPAGVGAGADIRVQISLDAKVYPGLKGHNTIAIVHGTNDAENIVVNAHGDGWFEAAGDNGDGFATVLALARYFARPEHKPARTLVFVISGGHHSTGLNGPQHLVEMNKELLSKTVMVINIEHAAQLAIHSRGGDVIPQPWIADPTEQAMGFGISNQSPFIADLGHRARERYRFNIRSEFGSSVPGDLGGYAPLGVARVQSIHSGPMYHTSGDTLDTISIPGLERAARFYAYFVSEAARAPRTLINP
jgi:hypothetical protein